MKTEYHILSLGAGRQSSTIYMMAHGGELHLDAAIFADTGEERQSTMTHLQWMDNLHSIPIHIISRGRLGDDLLNGYDSNGKRVGSIPVFMKTPSAGGGVLRRQCTQDYKIAVIQQWLRRDLLGLKPRQRIPKGVTVHMYYGISADEARRTKGILASCPSWQTANFPLIQKWWTARDCEKYLFGKVPHKVTSSACVFCPYRNDASWRELKMNDTAGWERAVYIDTKLRDGTIANKKLRHQLFLHRQLIPLTEVDFSVKPNEPTNQLPMFTEECEGMCGN